MPITVAEDAFHRQLFVTYLGEELRVGSIDQQWQDDAEPWEMKPVSKLHYKVTLEDGQRLPVFRNMEHRGWYRQQGIRNFLSDIQGRYDFRLPSNYQIASRSGSSITLSGSA